jgi:PAS domain S-box-containing protein
MHQLQHWLSTDGFMPHGMCYLWQPALLGLHVTSDALITLAYFSIPFTLVFFARKRRDLRIAGVLWWFAVFIIACGSSHAVDILTVWFPHYWLAGGVKAITALASVPTAILLVKWVPVALRVPSPSVLQAANAQLALEIAERRRVEAEIRALNESLEDRITARTAELSSAIEDLMTETREREQADELLKLTLASIQDGVIVTDIGGRITFMNHSASRLIGVDAESVTNAPLSSVCRVLHAESQMPTDLTTAAGDLVLLDTLGTEIPIDLRAVPLQGQHSGIRGKVYTLRDHTERRRADAIQQRMAALVDSAEDAILSKSLDGIVRSWNPGAERLLEYRADEIIGQPITRLIPEERREEESQILQTIESGNSVAPFETVRRRKSGSLVDVSLTISPIRNTAGTIIGASKIMRDITERKQAGERLRCLNEELQSRILSRNAELRERDVMLQEIHHRVKNNLQVISSLISMQVRTLRDDAVRLALRQCQSRVETMAQIHEMLYQSKNYAEVPFSRFIKELVTRVISASGESAPTVSIRYDLTDLSLPVDQAIPCGLILNELVSNSLKHAFPNGGGTIQIALQSFPDQRIELTIIDDGVGIPASYDPAKSKSLGMQLVNTLARQLDGSLDVIRQPGTTFRLRFSSEPRK